MGSDILSIHRALLNGEYTCRELVQERIDMLSDDRHNTSNRVLVNSAYAMAEAVDRKIADKEVTGILEGIPFGIKDVLLLQGVEATGSSKFLKSYIAPYTGTAIQKLLDAGAIPIVKENCDSFGHGSTNENSYFGPAVNARDDNRVAGGSSGGSSVNVALGHTVFSIGGDTGGSIRQPAGYNGVFGLKPTYGRVSRYGLMAYASSTDCVGPIARSPQDIRIILNTISGKDSRDLTTRESTDVPESVFDADKSLKGLKVGVFRNFIENGSLDNSIKTGFTGLLDKLDDAGVEINELDFFDSDLLVSAYYILAMAETASNLARLDGTSYGEREDGDDLRSSSLLSRSVNLSEETKRRIIGGNQVLSSGYSEQIYSNALALRAMFSNKFDELFGMTDLIISPVSPAPPPVIGESSDPLQMYLSDMYTVGFSLGGLPTLTAPLGTATGIQITSDKWREESILRFAYQLYTGIQ